MNEPQFGVFERNKLEWMRPDPIVRIYWAVKAIFLLTIIFGFFSLIIISASGSSAGVAGCCITWVIIFLVSYIWAVLFYDSYIFRINKDGVEINRGIMFKSERIIPFERIQHLTVTCGPLMSLFGISDINLFTAGTGSFGSSAASRGMFGAEGFIPGIKNPLPLRRTIMMRIEESRSGSGLGDEVYGARRTVSMGEDPMQDLLQEVRAIRIILSQRTNEELVEVEERIPPPPVQHSDDDRPPPSPPTPIPSNEEPSPDPPEPSFIPKKPKWIDEHHSQYDEHI